MGVSEVYEQVVEWMDAVYLFIFQAGFEVGQEGAVSWGGRVMWIQFRPLKGYKRYILKIRHY